MSTNSWPRSNNLTRDLRKQAGRWLRQLREKRGLSQRELAQKEKVGAEYDTLISQLEHGYGCVPANRYLAWADALAIEPQVFVRRPMTFYDPRAPGGSRGLRRSLHRQCTANGDWKPVPDNAKAGAGIGRRESIALIGGALLAPPLAAHAQQIERVRHSERVRHIGVLMLMAEFDPQAQARNAAFLQGLQELGWAVGRNVKIDYRWAGGGGDIRRDAAELAALAPDVILGSGRAAVESLLLATRTVPIVFVIVPDPVAAGFVDSLERPGGNATGLATPFEYGIVAKWLELLKQIAPGVTRAAVILDPATTAGIGQWGAMQAVAPSIGLEIVPVNIRDGEKMNRTLAGFGHALNGGLIVTISALAVVHRDVIVTLAARHKLPAVYYERSFVAAGGLISFGPDFPDQYRRAGAYVDRILKGEKPADLPVQTTTKYELVMNLETTKALGLDIPASVLAGVDEVVE